MSRLSCNACNKELQDDTELRIHYKSDWHRYNLKRKVAGVPGVTEALFLAKQSALAEEKNKLNKTPMLYRCGLCAKEYRSYKAHDQHIKSKSHIVRASQQTGYQDERSVIIKPLPLRVPNVIPQKEEEDNESEESEWEEVDAEENVVINSLTQMNVNGHSSNDLMDDDDDNDDMDTDLDPSSCFMCDLEHDTIEACMIHLHRLHGFFIPDVEYLKDPRGLLTYLGLKVKKDFVCLYCNDKCQPFCSLEAVRSHMVAKRHCKVHYGDGGDDDEEVELEEFYDYSSSYLNEDGTQMVASGDLDNMIEIGSGGSELIISQKADNRISTKTLGSREFLRYYRQKPRPTAANSFAFTAALASRYKSMGLATVPSRKHLVRMKVLKEMKRSGVEVMRNKIGMKSNVIRNLPKNVAY